jgi:hypothetical protein
MRKTLYFAIVIFIISCAIYGIKTNAADPSTPVTIDYSDFNLCTVPDSIFDGDCCAGASSLPTLRWNYTTGDTLCDCDNSPQTTVPTYKGIPTSVASNAEDCICGFPLATPDTSYQISYWLQVDEDSGFGTPEINTGEVSSGVKSYTISPGQLPNNTYYWRVGIKDQYGSITDWVAEASTFTVPQNCSLVTGVPVDPPPSLPLDLVEGSEFDLCAENIDPQPLCYIGNYPTPKLNWTFSSSQNDWNDTDGSPPTLDEGDPSDDSPSLSASTQAGYWIEIDNDSDFSSPVYKTGYVVSADNFHKVCFNILNFNTTYYWRVAVQDSYGSRGSPTVWSSSAASFTTVGKCTPNAPSDLEILQTPQPSACSFLKARWTDNSDNEDGFLVEKSDNGTNGWTTACNVGSNANSCYIPMAPHTLKFFRVSAYTGANYSAWEPLLNGVDGRSFDYCSPVLNIPSYNCDCANLLWTVLGDETKVHHYDIDKRINSLAWQTLVSPTQGTLSYSDCAIQSGVKLYEYKVTAYMDAAETIKAVSNIYKVIAPCQKLPVWKESK